MNNNPRKKREKHGLSRTKVESTLRCMIQRCFNDSNYCYHFYGGRGITVCTGWRESLKSFYLDMGHPPSPQHSIDRINSDGHYSCGHCDECLANGWPANCRWATSKQQANNKRTSRRVEIGGRSLTVGQWADETGVHPATIQHRLSTGVSGEDLIAPPKSWARYEYLGETLSLVELGRRAGVPLATIYNRIYRGWSVARAVETPRRALRRRR